MRAEQAAQRTGDLSNSGAGSGRVDVRIMQSDDFGLSHMVHDQGKQFPSLAMHASDPRTNTQTLVPAAHKSPSRDQTLVTYIIGLSKGTRTLIIKAPIPNNSSSITVLPKRRPWFGDDDRSNQQHLDLERCDRLQS